MSFRNSVVAMAMAVAVGGCGGGDDDDDDGAPRLVSLTASVGALEPAFDDEILVYDLDLLLAEDEVAFTLSASGSTDGVTLDLEPIEPGGTSTPLALTPGSRDVEIVLQRGDVRTTYTIHVHHGVDALAGLEPSLGELAPGFDPAATSYVLGLGRAEAAVTLRPQVFNPGRATITIDGDAVDAGATSPEIALADGSNLVTLEIAPATRPDAARTYELDIGRGADALGAITLSYAGGTLTNPLTPAVEPDAATYAASVGLWVQHLQVSVTPLARGGTATVFGGPASPGTASSALPLNLGLTSIPIVLTASDGAQQTYTLDVTRAAAVVEQAYAKASNTGDGDLFGGGVALWGDTLVVGAEAEDSDANGVDGDADDDSATDSGAVYVFTRSGASWAPQAYLKASNSGEGDGFGGAVALWGDTLVVGAPGEDSAATGVDGNQADNSALDSGAVYVFTRSGATWTQQAYLKASNTGAEDLFGRALAIHEDTLAIGSFETSGSPGIDGNQADDSVPDAGAVYVFTRTGETWSQQAYVKSSDPELNDGFGLEVAVWGDTLVASSANDDSGAVGVGGDETNNDSTNSGAVFVFTRTGTSWAQTAFLKASNSEEGDSFGRSVALWGDTLAVGADAEDSAAPGVDGDQTDDSLLSAGAVYVFERSAGSWSQQAYLKSPFPFVIGGFGLTVSLWGDTLAVGSFFESSNATGIDGDPADTTANNTGAVFVLTRTDGVWAHRTYLKASVADPNDSLGFAVALWGDSIAAGAPSEDSSDVGVDGDQDDNDAADAGAAYIFR